MTNDHPAHPLLDLIGLRPIIVRDLGEDSIILLDTQIILIDAEADLAEVIDHALSAAVDVERERWPDLC